MPPTTDPTLAALFAIMERCQLTYGEIASACGCSPNTLRISVLTGCPPRHEHARHKLRAFVLANDAAATRGDVRFTP